MAEQQKEVKSEVISGRNPVSEALRGSRPIDKIMVAKGEKSGAVVGILAKARDKKIPANILAATTRTVGGKVYGTMLLNIPGGPDELATAVKYLSKAQSVTVQVDVEYTTPQEEPAEEAGSNE